MQRNAARPEGTRLFTKSSDLICQYIILLDVNTLITLDYNPFLIFLFQFFNYLSLFIQNKTGHTRVNSYNDLLVFCCACQFSDLPEYLITYGGSRLCITATTTVAAWFTQGSHNVFPCPLSRHLNQTQF